MQRRINFASVERMVQTTVRKMQTIAVSPLEGVYIQ